MTERAHDHNSQEIRINGRFARAYAVYEFIGNLLRPLVVPLVIVLLGYSIHHDREHTSIDLFMKTGPRLTPDMMESRLKLERSEVMSQVGDEYPPSDLVEKVDENTDAITALTLQVGRMDERLTAKLGSLERAIDRLLED